MVFISSKMLFSRYSILSDIFPFFSTVSRFKGSDETGIIMASYIGLHKLASVIFG